VLDAQLHTTVLIEYAKIWRHGVVYEHSSCRHMAMQGALRHPAGHRNVAAKVNKM